jgi:hypothetical protein
MIPMSVEGYAKRIVEREMNRSVEIHDDGSRPGMYDLRIGDKDAPDVAIECVGAVDPVRTETWNLGPAKGPMLLALTGDWHVELRPSARVKTVRARIESLLRECEERKLRDFLPVWRLRRISHTLYSALDSLGIESVHCFRPDGTGEVHLGMTGIGGVADTDGREVPAWISTFIRAPEQADVLRKLHNSGAPECHVFVPVSFAGVPWAVESYLGRRIETLLDSPPDLPRPVTGVWITYAENGLRWDGVAWHLFNAYVGPKD